MLKQILVKTFYLIFFLHFFSGTALIAQNNYPNPPDRAMVLFDGTGFSHWTNCDGGEVRWKIVDGVMEVVPDTSID